ncbi:hypothetical protein [Streptomyces sp. KL116D]|uniref:hypothetical protein n=1 Tax=Streptomyces sp. KL116D TaxID=3045152 RepID=UPI003556106A
MITDQDLPKPWRVLASPVDQSSATQLDAVAGLETGIEDPVSWDLIENSETGDASCCAWGSTTAES